MKRMHVMLALVTVLALMLGLVGCGEPVTPTEPTTLPTTEPTEPPMTAEQVYANVGDAMGEAEATRLKISLSYDMSVTEGAGDAATTTEVSMDMVVDTMASEEPFGSYTLMDMALHANDEDMGYVMEVYLVEEEGSVVSYLQMFDMWIRSDYGMSVSDFLASGQMTEVSTEEVWSGIKPGDMTLEEAASNLNGTPVYVLHGTIPAGSMSEALSGLGIEDTSIYEDLELPVTYYVDTQNFRILRMVADMSFMVDVLDDVLAQSLTGTEAENANITLSISDVVYDLEYNTPSIPAVPQEAYDYIKENPDMSGGDSDPTEYDGPLVLNSQGDAYLVVCPKEWTSDYFGDTNVTIYNEDFSLTGDYYFFSELTREEVMNLAQIDADFLESAEILVSQGEGPAIPHYETWQVIGQGQSYYFAWRETGDGWLLIQIYDFTGTDDATELLPQFIGYLTPYGKD